MSWLFRCRQGNVFVYPDRFELENMRLQTVEVLFKDIKKVSNKKSRIPRLTNLEVELYDGRIIKLSWIRHRSAHKLFLKFHRHRYPNGGDLRPNQIIQKISTEIIRKVAPTSTMKHTEIAHLLWAGMVAHQNVLTRSSYTPAADVYDEEVLTRAIYTACIVVTFLNVLIVLVLS